MSVSSLVLDSGAFISGAQLTKFGANTTYITTPRVLAELRDSATRQAIEQFPFDIQTRTVSDDALNAVRVFAKKTGDLAVLSGTDVEIIALTYMLEKEANGLKNIRTEPRVSMDSFFLNGAPTKSASAPVSSEPVQPFASLGKAISFNSDSYLDDSVELTESSHDGSEFLSTAFPLFVDPLPESNASSSTAAPVDEESADEPESSESAAVASTSMPGWGDETNEPDEGTWITAENVSTAHDLEEVENAAPTTLVDVSAVAVITTDFAMQNVLLQMGLRLLSVNGIAVRTLRSSIKRCYGCYRIERNMDKEFCQHCGGHTLVRVAITVDANGNLKWKQSNRQVFWKRGTVYSIPKPKRGEIPMLLREDQLQVGRMRQLQNNKKRAERQAARAMFGEEANMGRGGRGRAAAAPATKSLMEASAFAAEKVVSRAEDIQFGYGRRNPNVNGRKKK